MVHAWRWTTTGLALTGLALAAALPDLGLPQFGSARAQSARKPPAVTWEDDFDAARAKAFATGKPLFVVFRCER